MNRLVKLVASLLLVCVMSGCDKPRVSGDKRTACVCAVKNWTEYSPPSRDFSVLMPFAPVTSVVTNDTAAGPIAISMYITEPSGTVSFGVIHSLFPDVVDVTDNAKLFDAGLEQAIGADGRLISNANIALEANPGREWKFKKLSGQATLTMRAYLVNRDFYQLISVMPSGRVCDQHVREFLDSFRVMPD